MPKYKTKIKDHPKYRAPKTYNKSSDKYSQACDIRSSERWKKTARYKKMKNPLCQWCKKAPTEEVHHIKPLVKYPELAFNLDNLYSVCKKCHGFLDTRTQRGEDVEQQIKDRE